MPKTTHTLHTIGDPTGIGSEITLKYLTSQYAKQPFKLTVIGSMYHLHETARQLNVKVLSPDEYPLLNFMDTAERINLPPDAPTFKGHVAYQSLVSAIELMIQDAQCRILVTGPINKAHLHQAGYHYGGHTEILEDLANDYFPKKDGTSWQSDMLFVYEQFRILLLTRHIPLSKVSEYLNVITATESLQALTDYLTREGITTPRYCMFGVNPHAGEIGGTEERDILAPIIKKVNQQSVAKITGPVAADGAFRGFNAANPDYDAYIAPYHDQGLIPMKLVGGYDAVNVTIGLPFTRTSVSHGTADDIVGHQMASANSLTAAFDIARHHKDKAYSKITAKQTAHLKHQ